MPLSFQDAQLLRRAQRGNAMSALQIFEIHGGALYGMALGVLGIPDDAEEVVAAVAAEMASGAGKYNITRPLLPQLARRNAAHIRRVLAGHESEAPPPSDGGEDSASWQAVVGVLNESSAKERLAFYTWAATGLTVKDAASVLDSKEDDYREQLRKVLSAAGLHGPESTSPLRGFETSASLFHKVEAMLVDEPEGADSDEARMRRRQSIRRRAYETKLSGANLIWLPLVLALVVIVAAIWNLDQAKNEKKEISEASPTAMPTIPTEFKIERDDP